jgi:hypothetical protein
LERYAGKAFRQIDDTRKGIEDGLPEFAAVSADRPLFGLVVTAEPL